MATSESYSVPALLPCPFCGCDDHECSPFPTNHKRDTWIVRCGNPSCNSEVMDETADGAVKRWNRRATELTASSASRRQHEGEGDVRSTGSLLNWAVERWHAEVAHRPIVNIHRRSLDDTWRQIIRKLGGDPQSLIGSAHDELRSAIPSSEWDTQKGNESREALRVLHDAFVADPSYAWAWHCNVAMASADAGAPHNEANERAADFMRHAFDFDTRQCIEWQTIRTTSPEIESLPEPPHED